MSADANTEPVSANTRAVLLLTAPLLAGGKGSSASLLEPGEYRALARRLHELGAQPSDLTSRDAHSLLEQCRQIVERSRLERLLARGFQLSRAVEHWRARGIWVKSRSDDGYPERLRARLRGAAPPIVYGCGDPGLLGRGGLAVVGSRKVGQDLLEYSASVGRLAALARRPVVSGGARGVDRAAMQGAIENGGESMSVLADGLERAAMHRENRDALLERRLVLISPYDPGVRFHVGHAMQRNKLVYALADAALIVEAEVSRGGTWAGAVEQLERLQLVPIFVRRIGGGSPGLMALRERGALDWAEPTEAEGFARALRPELCRRPSTLGQAPLPLEVGEERRWRYSAPPGVGSATEETAPAESSPAEDLRHAVRDLLPRVLETPKTAAEVAECLGVGRRQAEEWLKSFVESGLVERLQRPVRYALPSDRIDRCLPEPEAR